MAQSPPGSPNTGTAAPPLPLPPVLGQWQSSSVQLDPMQSKSLASCFNTSVLQGPIKKVVESCGFLLDVFCRSWGGFRERSRLGRAFQDHTLLRVKQLQAPGLRYEWYRTSVLPPRFVTAHRKHTHTHTHRLLNPAELHAHTTHLRVLMGQSWSEVMRNDVQPPNTEVHLSWLGRDQRET